MLCQFLLYRILNRTSRSAALPYNAGTHAELLYHIYKHSRTATGQQQYWYSHEYVSTTVLYFGAAGGVEGTPPKGMGAGGGTGGVEGKPR